MGGRRRSWAITGARATRAVEGAKAAAAIASNQEWRETRPAQFAVKEEKLVEAVREVLARHDVTWNN
jgi:hypothetical protein